MPVPPPAERRQSPRLLTTVPISLEWQSEQGEIRRVRGTTRDITRSGVYCFLEEALPPRLPVTFDVVFPAELTAANPLKLRCRGRILRSESWGRRFGVVASIDSHQVLETPEPAAESDRRASARVLPCSAIVVEYPGVRSVARDLSFTGAFVEDERPFPVGRLLDLHLRGDGLKGEVLVKAIVRRVEPQIGMAVEFVALSQQANEQLREIVEKNRQPLP